MLGCQGADLGTGEQAIIGGSPAPDEVAVVGLARHAGGCQPATVVDCTATLVAPRVIVTAAHCLGLDPPNVYQVFFGASVAGGGTLVSVVGGRAHPDFDPQTYANDIAALILAEDPPPGVAPIAMRTTPLPDLAGTEVTLVGFGVTALDAQDTGVRIAGAATITSVGAETIDYAPGPAMSCHGDSGGPVLVGGELVAVTTHGDAACAQVGHAVRVDRQQELVQTVIAEAAGASARRSFDPDEPFCSTTCTTDTDCPAETVCFAVSDEPRRCVYRGLPAGTFREACPTGDQGPCVTVPDGSCRRLAPCGESIDDGCGCRTTTSPSWLLALAWLVRTRGSRRRSRCVRRTASPSRDASPR